MFSREKWLGDTLRGGDLSAVRVRTLRGGLEPPTTRLTAVRSTC